MTQGELSSEKETKPQKNRLEGYPMKKLSKIVALLLAGALTI